MMKISARLGATMVACALAIVPAMTQEQAKPPSWYSQQTLNPATMKRLGTSNASCCDHGDVFRTRFRVVQDGSRYGAETYEYERAPGVWKTVPPDIVQRKPTPDGRPVLFINPYSGTELCFVIDEPGL